LEACPVGGRVDKIDGMKKKAMAMLLLLLELQNKAIDEYMAWR
jgi:hypothetical protein